MHDLEIGTSSFQVIAESLSEEEIAGLKEMFKMIDTDNSGYITFQELKDGLKRYGANVDEAEIYDLMKAVSNLLLPPFLIVRLILSISTNQFSLIRISKNYYYLIYYYLMNYNCKKDGKEQSHKQLGTPFLIESYR